MLKSDDLYPLIDALGLSLKIGRRDAGRYPLEGSQKMVFSVPSLHLDLPYEVKVIESLLVPGDFQTTAVRVHVIGLLQLVVLLDHKRNRLETFVLDGGKLEQGEELFQSRWSRLKFMFAVRQATVAHFTWVEPLKAWQETPKASRWVLDYLTLRDTHKLSADDGMELADAWAFGLVERTEDMPRKWINATRAWKNEQFKTLEPAR